MIILGNRFLVVPDPNGDFEIWKLSLRMSSWLNELWYKLIQRFVQVGGVAFFGLRSRGHEKVPLAGPLIVVANHQSNGDPPLIGCIPERRFAYLAKKTLFNFPPLAWLIRSLHAIPIDRDGMGLEGFKQTLKRLKQDEAVLIFPEGQRSWDGQIMPLMPGFLGLVRRSKAVLQPVGIAGMYESWPRGTALPKPGRVIVEFGDVISRAEIERLSDEELLALVDRKIRECFEVAKKLRG